MKVGFILAAIAAVTTTALFLSSCSFMAVKGTGDVKTNVNVYGKYSKVIVEGDVEVIIDDSGAGTVTAVMQDNLLNHFKISENNGVVTVARKDNRTLVYEKENRPKIYISSSDLEEINAGGLIKVTCNTVIESDKFLFSLSGAGSANLNLNTKNLTLKCSGSGSANLTGSADNTNITISGAGSIDAYSLNTKTSDINISGAGGCDITCSDNLNVSISGAGSVNYQGDPSVSQSISGIGKVKKV